MKSFTTRITESVRDRVKQVNGRLKQFRDRLPWMQKAPREVEHQVLFLSNRSSLQPDFATVRTWNNETLPSLVGFDLVVADLPDGSCPEAIQAELKLLTEVGIPLVFLISHESNLSILKEIAPELEIRPLPRPIVGRKVRSAEEPIRHYLTSLDRLAFVVGPKTRGEIFGRIEHTTPLPVAVRKSHLFVMPGKVGVSVDDLQVIIEYVAKASTMRLAFSRSARRPILSSFDSAITRICAAVGAIALVVTIARYHQKAGNHRLLNPGDSILAEPFEVPDFSTASSLANVATLASPAFLEARPEEIQEQKLEELLDTCHRLELHSIESKIIHKFRDSEAHEYCLSRYHSERIFSDIERFLSLGRVESARRRALAFVHHTERASTACLTDVSHRQLFIARRVAEMTSRVSPYTDQDAFRMISRALFDPQSAYELAPLLEQMKRHPELMRWNEEADYWEAALQANENFDPRNAEVSWTRFIELHPDGRLTAEARFNLLNARISIIDNGRVLDEAINFSKDFPRHYLSDDARKYAIVFSAATRNQEALLDAIESLHRENSQPESWRRFIAGIGGWVEERGFFSGDGQALFQLLCDAATAPDEISLSHLESSGRISHSEILAIASICGVSKQSEKENLMRNSARNVLTELVFSWWLQRRWGPYFVKEGDTVRRIANQFEMEEEEFRTLNELDRGEEVVPGSRVKIRK